ncbi:MAG: hypothetical protein Q8S31_05095 [Alphaproteobacteria bacterium]|nr:hypothetical protein [Alphaproteobacteria bacterium]
MKNFLLFIFITLTFFSATANEHAEKNKIFNKILLSIENKKSEKDLKFYYMKNLYSRLFEKFQSVSRRFNQSHSKFNDIFVNEYFKEKQKERKINLDIQKKLYLSKISKSELQEIAQLKIHPMVLKYALNIVGSNFDSNDFKLLLSQNSIYNPATPNLLKEILTDVFQKAQKENVNAEKLNIFEKAVFDAFESEEFQKMLSNYITTTDKDMRSFNYSVATDLRTPEKEQLAQEIADGELAYLNNPEIYRLNRLLVTILYKAKKLLNGLDEEQTKFFPVFKDYIKNEGRKKIIDFYQKSFIKIMATAMPDVYTLQELKEIKHFNRLESVKKIRKLSAEHHNHVKNKLIKDIKAGKAPFQIALVRALNIAKKQGLDSKIINEELAKLKVEFKALSKD